MVRYKSIYSEEAIQVDNLIQDQNLCLMMVSTDDFARVIFYDKSKITIIGDNITIPVDSIYSYGEMETSDSNPFKCWSVIESAAMKNYGPSLYDTMMSIAGVNGLMPDRGSVSVKARGVWEYYFSKRKNDFEKILPIDNFTKPHTPNKDDDGFIHNKEAGYEDRDLIDRVYYFKHWASHLKKVKPMKQRHNEFCKSSGVSKSGFEKKLGLIGIKFFNLKYNEV